ncbi:hypothetical protein ZIOFF_038149 [Zingiber officinale]|uniref:Pleiotropic ABC efflux transporter N-terminal domain-containing protein n=1 Tax=Zingiber officinale TaxID=94328 RepID=A0A8J5GKZ9_ZINOF|nr:hypothetical protein ZIOFF_038149 [Zingiber officinale]
MPNNYWGQLHNSRKQRVTGQKVCMEKVEGFSITCEEHEELISSLRDWRTRSGINAPKIEVRFEDLSVETEVHASRRVLPTLPNAIINTVQVPGSS